MWQGGSFWHSKSWLEQLKAAGKGLGFHEKPVILDFSEVWHILLEDGLRYQHYKANTWRTLYSQCPQLLETEAGVCPKPPCFSPYVSALAEQTDLQETDLRKHESFLSSVWFSRSSVGWRFYHWDLSVLQCSSWWGACAGLGVPSVPKHISARNLTLC